MKQYFANPTIRNSLLFYPLNQIFIFLRNRDNPHHKYLRLFSPEYTNPANSYVFGSTLDGCAIVRNSVIVNGNLKEWHSDLVLAATPTLDEFLYHYIVDTTTTE